MRGMVIVAAVLLLFGVQGHAQTILSGGATYSVSGSSTNITVEDGTTLNVGTGAAIAGSDGTSPQPSVIFFFSTQ
jgi:hypothetical protein